MIDLPRLRARHTSGLMANKALNLYPVLSAGAPATGPQTPAQETPVGVITQHLYIAPGATKPQSCTFKP